MVALYIFYGFYMVKLCKVTPFIITSAYFNIVWLIRILDETRYVQVCTASKRRELFIAKLRIQIHNNAAQNRHILPRKSVNQPSECLFQVNS